MNQSAAGSAQSVGRATGHVASAAGSAQSVSMFAVIDFAGMCLIQNCNEANSTVYLWSIIQSGLDVPKQARLLLGILFADLLRSFSFNTHV